jgi:hypothetical protein
VDAAATIEAARELAFRIRTLRPSLWTDPERFFEDRSELAHEAHLLAEQIAKLLGIAPEAKGISMLRVEREKGRGRAERTIEVINGRRVTVQRARASFSISTGNKQCN